MPKHHAARHGEFLASHTFAVMRIAQDVNDADTTMPDRHLTFDGQFPYYLILLNIALPSWIELNVRGRILLLCLQ